MEPNLSVSKLHGSKPLRTLGLVFTGLSLLGLMAGWSYTQWTRPVGLRACVHQPQRCAGATMWLPLMDVVAVDETQGGAVQQGSLHFNILGDMSGFEPGETVSVYGSFDSTGTSFTAMQWEEHPKRRLKKQLGILGLLFTACLVVVCFRFSGFRVRLNG